MKQIDNQPPNRHEAATSKTCEAVIVVPCYNEASRLDTDAFVKFVLQHSGVRFLFVDDGSSDGTLGMLAQMQMRAPHVLDVLVMSKNQGKAEAVRQGLHYASGLGVDFVGYLDADLATPLEAVIDMQRVVNVLSDVEVVFGSRQRGVGHRVHRDLVRRLISFICARLARLATGLPLADTQCGAKLFRNNATLQAAISQPFQAGWLFDVELALRLMAKSTQVQDRFYELPLMQWQEVAGSNIKSMDVWKSGLVMLRLIATCRTIKSEFARRIDEIDLLQQSKVTLQGRFDLQSIAYLRERSRTERDFTQVDLSHVEDFGPSVFPALIGICDDIKQRGQEPSILLPDDNAVCHDAARAGLTTLYPCRRIASPIPAEDKTRSPASREAA